MKHIIKDANWIEILATVFMLGSALIILDQNDTGVSVSYTSASDGTSGKTQIKECKGKNLSYIFEQITKLEADVTYEETEYYSNYDIDDSSVWCISFGKGENVESVINGTSLKDPLFLDVLNILYKEYPFISLIEELGIEL